MHSLAWLAACSLAMAGYSCRRSPAQIAEPAPDARPAAPAPALPLAERTLPPPDLEAGLPLHRALRHRRSVREFLDSPLTDSQLSQLAWAAQGITDASSGLRTAPSAGALFPIELYFVTASGALHYLPARHSLTVHRPKDLRPALAHAALDQLPVRQAPCVIAIASVNERTRVKYGDRAARYAAIEAGHVAQNILLEAVSLGLGGVPVGAFDDTAAHEALELDPSQQVLYLVPLGTPKPR